MAREISNLIWGYLEVEHGFSRYENNFEIRRVLFKDAYEVNVFKNGSRQIVKKFTFTDEQLENIGKSEATSTTFCIPTKFYPLATEVINGTLHKEKETTMNRLEAEAVLNNAAKALAKIELLEQKYGVDPDYKNGDGFWIKIRYRNSDTIYDYAVIKANYMWYSTAVAGSAFKRGSFDQLISWLENLNGTIVRMSRIKCEEAFIKNGKKVAEKVERCQ